jgi:uncharacterized protein YjbI with pentapeptide repeats
MGFDLHGFDLHGFDLHGFDLHGFDLHGFDLNMAAWLRCDRANLSGRVSAGSHGGPRPRRCSGRPRPHA